MSGAQHPTLADIFAKLQSGDLFRGEPNWGKLALSIIIGMIFWVPRKMLQIAHLIGVLSYLIPAIGELSDAIWAPISAVLLSQLYGMGPIVVLGFLEEAFPFTDFVPTATIAWVLQYTTLVPDNIRETMLGRANVQAADNNSRRR